MEEKAKVAVGLTLTQEEADDLRLATNVDALAIAARVAVREKIAEWKADKED